MIHLLAIGMVRLGSGVAENDRARQGGLFAERMAEFMIEHECFSARVLWVRLKIGLIP